MRHVTILFNEPVLPHDHPDYVSEAGVLESVEAFATALGTAGYEVKLLGLGRSLAQLIERLSCEPPDVVVNFCEGFAGRSGGEAYVTGLLELLGLMYTGSSPECLALVRDKVRTKQVLIGAGIPTADYWTIPRDAALDLLPVARMLREQLATGKLFVKPAAEDASLGIDDRSVVADWAGLAAKVIEVQNRYGDVLVERYLDGREFNVGIIALGEPQTLPIAEIEFQTGPQLPIPILTYASKWRNESSAFHATPVRCPADVDDLTAARIRDIALAAFAATGCRDYARVDLRLTTEGGIYVLEVNANPDVGPAAGFARALDAAGMAYYEFAKRLINTAVMRDVRAGEASPSVNMHPPSETPGRATHVAVEKVPVMRDAPSRELSSTSPAASLIRPLRATDRQALLEILAACRMFRQEEIDVADEILGEAIRDGDRGHYRVLVAEAAGEPIGWSCHGCVPLTDATYDLYWIAVHPDHQRKRIGRVLLAKIEGQLRNAKARWLLAETSSTALYDKTRNFYEKAGFTIVGDVSDFYRAEDGRITYGKRLQ